MNAVRLVHFALAAMATNAVIACGDADVIGGASPPPSEPYTAPAPVTPDASPPEVPSPPPVNLTLDAIWTPADAGSPPLPTATCSGSCLPLTWLADVLRNAGLDVWEDPDWRTRGHGSFDSLWGVMAHHTGVERDTEWMVVRDGRSDLKGPLSQLVLEKNGMFRVVASGVAWHAGNGSYPGMNNDANWRTIGIEAVNTGLESWSMQQYQAYVRGVAAILKYLGLDASRVIGHKEWAGVSQGKWDPGGIDMDSFRSHVQLIMDK